MGNLPRPFAGSESCHTSGHRSIDQSDLVAATWITHRVEESEYSMGSFKQIHKVLMAIIGDLDRFDSWNLIFERILGRC